MILVLETFFCNTRFYYLLPSIFFWWGEQLTSLYFGGVFLFKRIAVIENEFGDGLSVESLIARDGVEDADNNNNNSLQDLIELPNGCVCCTVKDTLVETLEILIKKRNDLDYILIEAR